MNPISNKLHAVCSLRLGYLAFVMRKLVVQSSAMYIYGLAQILHSHHRTFQMPARKTHTPRAGPLHDMIRLGFLPKGKIDGISFVLRDLHANTGQHFLGISAGKLAVIPELGHIEVNGAVCLVSETFFQKRLYHLYLLDNMACCSRADIRPDAVEPVHVPEVIAGIVLCYSHWVFMLSCSGHHHPVLALLGIAEQMAHIGYVLDIGDIISDVPKLPNRDIKAYIALRVSKMCL